MNQDQQPPETSSDSPLQGEYKAIAYPDPALLVSFFDKGISEGKVTLHPWQLADLKLLGDSKPTSQHPFRYCLCASNGSGKDKYIIAPFAVWFALCKIRSRVIITSASGTQLTAQTETYVRDLCAKVNEYFGAEIFRIRQRYIYCRLSGSEIRMFATDEKGRAEGYHPFDADGEMAIIVNEGKSVTEEIHSALRRCTGFNYWLEVSSPGEPNGYFYRAATTWQHVRRVTSYDCTHISREEIEIDKSELGEHSALFRSKHLALFTSIGGEVIIPLHLVESLLENPPTSTYPELKEQVGIDIAAGGAENSLCRSKGNKCITQYHFREVDTTVTADRIDCVLKDWGIKKDSGCIYADDGGVGHAVIDMLERKGWVINRVLNQWSAINKKNYGNRGAENWYRVKRLIEERIFDVSTLDKKTIEQLTNRHYKQTSTSGRIFLESKKEAIASGRPSPDRADAFVLSMTGLNIESFLATKSEEVVRPAKCYATPDAAYEDYENNVTYHGQENLSRQSKRIFNCLSQAI